MRMRLLVALAAGLMVGAADPAPDLGKAESQEIPPGSRWLDTGLAPRIWEFGRDGILRWTPVEPGMEIWEVPYSLDPMANPPRFDIGEKIGRFKGIYRVEGNRLLVCILCIQRPGLKTRPTRFANERDTLLYTLKRLK